MVPTSQAWILLISSLSAEILFHIKTEIIPQYHSLLDMTVYSQESLKYQSQSQQFHSWNFETNYWIYFYLFYLEKIRLI